MGYRLRAVWETFPWYFNVLYSSRSVPDTSKGSLRLIFSRSFNITISLWAPLLKAVSPFYCSDVVGLDPSFHLNLYLLMVHREDQFFFRIDLIYNDSHLITVLCYDLDMEKGPDKIRAFWIIKNILLSYNVNRKWGCSNAWDKPFLRNKNHYEL